MKRNIKISIALSLAALACSAQPVKAQSLGDILSDSGNILSNVMEGVFSSSDLTVADLTGQWTSSGPAVCFQTDNLLKKAGGIAAAAAIETKLAPYYKQYGLDGAVFTIQKDGSFSLKVKSITLKGTIEQAQNAKKGVFICNFKMLGFVTIGNLNMYVQKTSNSMDVMFDATKLKQLIAAIANLTGNSMAKTLGTILDSYDGLCVGFALNKTGNADGSTQTTGNTGKSKNTKTTSGKSKTSSGKNKNSSGNSTIQQGLESLEKILKGSGK